MIKLSFIIYIATYWYNNILNVLIRQSLFKIRQMSSFICKYMMKAGKYEFSAKKRFLNSNDIKG